MVLPVLIVSVCLVSVKVQSKETTVKKTEEINNNITLLVSDTTKPGSKKNVKLLPPAPPTPPPPAPLVKTVYAIDGVQITEGAPPPPPLVKPVYYLDGVKITEKEMNAISPNDIQSVEGWKGEKAIKKYHEDGKNGVVSITTKKVIK